MVEANVIWSKANSALEGLGRTQGETVDSLGLRLRSRAFLALAIAVFAFMLAPAPVGSFDGAAQAPATLLESIPAGMEAAYVRSARFVSDVRVFFRVRAFLSSGGEIHRLEAPAPRLILCTSPAKLAPAAKSRS